jgi:hypothetical protein
MVDHVTLDGAADRAPPFLSLASPAGADVSIVGAVAGQKFTAKRW